MGDRSGALPFLPGYSISTAHGKNHAKSHHFDLCAGVPVTDKFANKVKVKGPLDEKLIPAFGAKDIDKIGGRNAKPGDVMSKKPDWVTHDRNVLRFYAFTVEGVLNSRVELERVRKYVIYFYMADKSIHIDEARDENSGIPQGIFLHRHKVPKTDTEFFGASDFQVGGLLRVYGRTFHIVDADVHTRAFMQEEKGVDLAPAQDYPVDAHTIKLAQAKVRTAGGANDIRLYVEATLGAQMKEQLLRTRQFLAHDREVLKFECMWDDPAVFGESRKYFRLLYYLSDNTVEVLEPHASHMKNSGRDPYPRLVKRMPLPKRTTRADVANIGHNDAEFYMPEDFRIGGVVNVYNREFVLTKADAYTVQWYKHRLGRTDADFDELHVDQAHIPIPVAPPPEHDGIGTDEDSLGSCMSLRPRPPKKNVIKMLNYDKKQLRFRAKLANPVPEDVDRRFVIAYYLADDTLSIFELYARNTGFVGGKFLERRKEKNPATGRYYRPHEFEVGKPVTINAHRFDILEEDVATSKLKAKENI